MRVITLITLMIPGFSTFANDQFEGIDRDVTIMTQILEGVFEAEDQCRHCRIETHYLAEQGIVFFISVPRLLPDGEYGVEVDLSDLDVPDIAGLEQIPAMVDGVLADLEVELQGLEPWIYMGDEGRTRYLTIVRGVSREIREAMRDVRRERRDIQRQIRENEIKMIHEEGEASREEINDKVMALSEKLAELEKKEEKLNARLREAHEQARARREEAREKMRKARQERQRAAEDTVLRTLCDYGSTLKNLPDDEHVSIVFEEFPSADGDTVYVFKRRDVARCTGGADKLKEQAVSYRFNPM